MVLEPCASRMSMRSGVGIALRQTATRITAESPNGVKRLKPRAEATNVTCGRARFGRTCSARAIADLVSRFISTGARTKRRPRLSSPARP